MAVPREAGLSRPSGRPVAPTGLAVVCTVAEGSYFNGVAALVNSLVQAGFAGEVVVGHRGALPDWFESLPRGSMANTRVVTPEVILRAVALEGPWHLANLKPRFISDIFRSICPEAELVYYFDTDMVVAGAWENFARWASEAVVLVLDVFNSSMSPQHVYRQAWRRLATARGFDCREVTGYFNSGCVGIPRRHAAFADAWADLMLGLADDGLDMTRIKYHQGPPEFTLMDQDVLNVAVMASSAPVNLLGSEAMGSYERLAMMPHAMFERKPWARRYIYDALRGIPPGGTHRAYWRFVDGPIRPFSRATLARKRLVLAIAHGIGLVHVRNPRDL